MDLLHILRKQPLLSKDNLVIDNIDTAIEEISHFKRNLGESLVDLSTLGVGRNILGLKTVSEKTGVNIIAATGFYRVASHPLWVKDHSISTLSDSMMSEITEGIGSTKIKAGIIKCASSSGLFDPQEERVLKAAAQTQRETGIAVTLHPSLYLNNKPSMLLVEKCLDVYAKEGGDLTKFVLSHSQGILSNTKLYAKNCKTLFEAGITLCFEFGSIFYDGNSLLTPNGIPTINEQKKIRAVVELCRMGYDKQIMISQDVYLKIMLKKYGGYGYSHIVETIVPILKNLDITKNQLKNILINNPKRILQY